MLVGSLFLEGGGEMVLVVSTYKKGFVPAIYTAIIRLGSFSVDNGCIMNVLTHI